MNKNIELAVADLGHAYAFHALKIQQLKEAQDRVDSLYKEVCEANGAVHKARESLDSMQEGEKYAESDFPMRIY